MVLLCARVRMSMCVKGHSWSKEKPDSGGAEIMWLRPLKGSCRTVPVPPGEAEKANQAFRTQAGSE